MRKIVAGLFTSLDGVVSSPDGWHLRYLDGQVLGAITALLPGVDAMLFGGRTYDEFARLWAGQRGSASAEFFNSVHKYVVTSRCGGLGWGPVTRLSGDPLAGIAELKAKPGGDILVQGSPTLVRTLLRAGLLDELGLLVLPVVVGTGLRLFDGADPVTLALADSIPFANGAIRLSYRTAQGRPA